MSAEHASQDRAAMSSRCQKRSRAHQDCVKIATSAGEAVADAGLGADVARARPVGLDLAAQVGHVRAQRRDVVGVGRAPDLVSSAAWVSSRPAVASSARCSSSNSVGVRWTSAPSRRGRRAQPGRARARRRSSTGSSAAGAARRSAASQARDELARAERLGHVVVGAGLERADLLAPRRRSPTARGSASASTRAAGARPRCRRRRAARGR